MYSCIMQYAISLHNIEFLQCTKLQIIYCCGTSILCTFFAIRCFASVHSTNEWCLIYIVGIQTSSQVTVCHIHSQYYQVVLKFTYIYWYLDMITRIPLYTCK